ncbi:NAD(P)/FAD-dependent oxidoreductase [Alicyclobacillus fastidiosus]|uniref:NAD(P)/FAD-dependent oxidoreductase n=1 Tax=Alicyclobacillus fastidiosus TaxID=392011 RepID=A0ABY6ZEP7_9BACL|nr:NAD(P)/FAD-dependent oxidoreductase [Alicyclobacillus fastidiosus]WAH41028.1 NAD(P)/FAD-dependent oxidoreductase [Alicyclobacillus fastidiosus]GMA62551.1 pyridine nucleotide-disulfide oxidoreductase [Alicyclobacillus fastidiosus]
MTPRRVLIIGAGYGGMAAAVRLQKHHIPFTLINKHDYHYFKTLLHEAAGGREDLQTYAIALTDVLDQPTSTVVKDVVTSIDYKNAQVRGEHSSYPYDTLIVALGSQTSYFDIPGLREHSLVLNSLESAKRIREHIEHTFLTYREQRDESMLRVVIGGGGLTGVELAGELADCLPHFLKRHNIPASDYKLVLVHPHDEILPGVDERLRKVAAEKLAARGVRLLLGRHVIGANDGSVALTGGLTIEARTFIWTGGVEASPLLRDSGFCVDSRGRSRVDAYLQSEADPRVYIVGDAARFEDAAGEVLPPTGQVAEQMGDHAARNLIRLLHNETLEPFVFHNRGMVASLGPKYGVAEVGHHHARGFAALMLKDGSKMKYLMHLGGPHVLFEKRKQWIDI